MNVKLFRNRVSKATSKIKSYWITEGPNPKPTIFIWREAEDIEDTEIMLTHAKDYC